MMNDCSIILGETECAERVRLSKVSKGVRRLLKEYKEANVERYWNSNRQISVDGDLKLLRKEVLETRVDGR